MLHISLPSIKRHIAEPVIWRFIFYPEGITVCKADGVIFTDSQRNQPVFMLKTVPSYPDEYT